VPTIDALPVGGIVRTKLIATAAALGLVVAAVVTRAGDDETAKLLPLLGHAKHSLADGIKQAQAKAPEVAISAKFELEEGKLSLSVYTAEKGLAVDAEHNVLKELAGNPEGEKWTPETEVFKDVPHVARSAAQLSLMALARCSLLEVLDKAAKDEPSAKPFSITPVLRDRKGEIVVLAAKNEKVVELRYDTANGDRVRMER
jgi:hypothetical protein